MEEAGQFDQQINGAAALSILHTADMLLACQSQANSQFLLCNATGSTNIVKSLTNRTGPAEGQKRSRMTVKKNPVPIKQNMGIP